MQPWHALRQLRRPRASRPGQCGPECDDGAKQQADQEKGTRYSRHTKPLQHPQGRLQEKLENDGKDDGQDDLPRRIKRGEERQHEQAALEDAAEVDSKRHLELLTCGLVGHWMCARVLGRTVLR